MNKKFKVVLLTSIQVLSYIARSNPYGLTCETKTKITDERKNRR